MQTSAETLASVFDQYRTQLGHCEEERATLKHLIDTCPLPMFLSKTTGQLLFANRAYLMALNAKLADVLNFDWLAFVHPSDKNRLLEEWKKLAIISQPKISVGITLMRSDGDMLKVTFNANKLTPTSCSGFIICPELIF